MFVSTFGTGMSLGVPDVCMTPPFAIPAPFPNLAQNAMAIPSYFTVAINAMPELNMTAMYAMSNGDEGGTMGGVASGMVMGPGRCMLGFPGGFRRRTTNVAADCNDIAEPDQCTWTDVGTEPDRETGTEIARNDHSPP